MPQKAIIRENLYQASSFNCMPINLETDDKFWNIIVYLFNGLQGESSKLD